MPANGPFEMVNGSNDAGAAGVGNGDDENFRGHLLSWQLQAGQNLFSLSDDFPSSLSPL